MKSIITFIVWLMLCGFTFADNMFGLGDPEPVEVAVFTSAETFGLGDVDPIQQPTPAVRQDGQLAIALRRESPVRDGLFENKPVRSVVKAALLPVVRRSEADWTDPDVGTWTALTLIRHLEGELESPQHRGLVPAGQLVGRSLADLKAIHANLHEGWAWDGRERRVATVKRSLHVQPPTVRQFLTVQSSSQCPGGVCPTNQSRPRIFRRR
jgi:hypothetical protein